MKICDDQNTKRVRFAEFEHQDASHASNLSNEPSLKSLSSVDSACDYLLQPHSNTGYLAYLYEKPPCEHSFYISRDTMSPPRDPKHQKENLQALLGNGHTDQYLLPSRFRLAIQLVYAVLQGHSTPWLKHSWSTSDVFFEQLSPSHEDLNLVLFLRSRFAGQGNTDTPFKRERLVSEDEGKSRVSSGPPTDIGGIYDIGNMTLFSLGVALLEIGHWTPISQMRLDGERDEIATALRVAQERHAFGWDYGEIVRRCMQCQFGYGRDLNKPELQSAVYSSVVRPLQELVNSLGGRS